MKLKTTLIIASLSALIVASCNGPKTETNGTKDIANSSSREDLDLLTKAQVIFKELPETAESAENPITPEKVALGKLLFYDTRLSKTGQNSCNSCHNLSTFGVDREATSLGDAGKRGGTKFANGTQCRSAFAPILGWKGKRRGGTSRNACS